jgi:protein-tyrosine phosphatase
VRLVRIPIRDGQIPTQEKVDRFVEAVRSSSGRVFVHCGAGVGRTGAMAASYLVRVGKASPAEALRRNLAVGPPSLEQVAFVADLDAGHVARPSMPLVAVSRVLDAPRRLWSRFGV